MLVQKENEFAQKSEQWETHTALLIKEARDDERAKVIEMMQQ